MVLVDKNGKLFETQSGKEVTGIKTPTGFQTTEKEFERDILRNNGKVHSHWISVFTHNLWVSVG